MTARPIRRNAQTPDRNGKIFYTSTTSLSHISKKSPLVFDMIPLTLEEIFIYEMEENGYDCKGIDITNIG